MKKPFIRIVALALLLQPFCAEAKTVSENAAKLAGANHLKKKGVSAVTGPNDLSLVYTATTQADGKTTADYYVFNVRNTDGFVLVTADDKVTPVLAWSDEASFHYDQIAPSAKAWLGWYQRQIEYMITHDVAPTQATEAAWKSLEKGEGGTLAAKMTSVSPLVTTLWDQSPYYNATCPGSGSSKAVTGCVATAMAQVMKFWNWPKMGEGMHNYVDATYGFRQANFGTTTYQWSTMPTSVSAANAAVATLMYHCGVSVNMRYGTAASGGSGSWPVNVYSNFVNCSEFAFRTYFHYKPTVKGIIRFGETYLMYPIAPMTTTAWISALQAELNAGRPFIYTGNDGTSGGHAWVADGYQSSDNFFHFNWGWGGSGPNGYYSVDDVAPPVLGTGGSGGNFNFLQTATIGIEPDTYPTSTDNIKIKQPMNFTTSIPVAFNKPISFTTKVMNGRTTTFTGEVGALVYDNTTHVATIKTVTGLSIAPGDSTGTLTFDATSLPRLVSKRYTLRLAYRNTGSGTWTFLGNNDPINNFAVLDVRNDTGVRMYDSIKVTSGLPMTPGGGVSLSTTIRNRSADDFSGSLKAQLVNVNTGVVYPISTVTGSSINAWNTSYEIFSTTSLTAPAGLYALEILHQYNGTGPFYTIGSKDFQNPKLVQVGTWTDVKPLNSIPDEIFAYPNPTRDYVNVIFNNHKVSEVIVSDITGRVLNRMAAPEGEATMQIPMLQYAPGTYLVQFVTNNGIISKKINIAE